MMGSESPCFACCASPSMGPLVCLMACMRLLGQGPALSDGAEGSRRVSSQAVAEKLVLPALFPVTFETAVARRILLWASHSALGYTDMLAARCKDTIGLLSKTRSRSSSMLLRLGVTGSPLSIGFMLVESVVRGAKALIAKTDSLICFNVAFSGRRCPATFINRSIHRSYRPWP